jgi:membrane protein YqaA with SNARE-associated domain
MPDRPPAVWIPSLGHGAGILRWQRRPDGWWAHLICVTAATPGGLTTWGMCAHASLIQPRQGRDYSGVPRQA